MVNEAEGKTDPDMVADFVERTGCDTLAVSVEMYMACARIRN